MSRGSLDVGRRRWRRLAALLSFGLSLIVVETGLRLMDGESDGFHLFDPVRGWRLNPGFEGWYEEENHVWVRINSDGLRDREHPVEAQPGTIRVAVLGDSFMEALNVPFEQTFAAVLERQLDRCLPGGRRAEVINFGVAGYGTVQQLLTLRHHVTKYRPDLVLLAVYTSNDILDNHADLQTAEDDWRPYFQLRGETLELAPSPAAPQVSDGLPWYQRWRVAVTDRSLAANLIYGGWSAFRARWWPPAAAPAPVMAAADGGIYRDALIYQPPTTAAIAEAWRITEATFGQLSEEVAASGGEFWLATLSNKEQVHPDVGERRAFAAKLGVESLLYPDHRIRDFAGAHGIPFILLAEPLADYSQRTGAFLNGGYNAAFPDGTGHWNDTAHRLAAGIVGDRLCAESRSLH